jgi:hypothetical protein
LSGVRKFYQIDDTLPDADVAYINCYDSMSDAETGVGNRGGGAYFGKHYSAANPDTSWHVVADEKTCYVMLRSLYGYIPHGFGEFWSLVDVDPHKAFLSGHGTAVYMSSYGAVGMMASSTSAKLLVYRDPDGTLRETPVPVYMALSPLGEGSGRALNSTSDAPAVTAGIAYPVVPAWMWQTGPPCAAYGHLRGVYYPVAYRPKADGEEFVFEGKNMLSLDLGANGSSTLYLGQIWLDITGSWEEST